MIANIFDSRTILACNTQLSNGFNLLQATGLILEQSIKPAKTLSTAKRRLGLDYNKYIEKIPICDKCYKNYTYEDIKRLLSSSCTVKQSKGKVYQVKQTASIKGDETDPVEKRNPMKILPYISLIKGLHQMLMRLSFVDNLVASGDLEEPFDENTWMFNIQNSPAYKTQEIGLKQVVNDNGTVQDIEVSPGSHKQLESCDIGLGLTINMDW